MKSGLPQLYCEIAEAAGLDAARALADAKAGQRIYIPKTLAAAKWLVDIVGEAAALKLIAQFNGLDIDLPTNPFGGQGQWARVREIHRLLDDGLSTNQVVALVGGGRGTVFYHRRRRKQRAQQPDLFSKL